MARSQRIIILLFVLLVASSTSYLSERTFRAQDHCPLAKELYDRSEAEISYQPKNQYLAKLLLTPTSLFHIIWITGLSLIFVLVCLDTFLKLVYLSCSGAVKHAVPQSFPVKPRYSYGSVWRHNINLLKFKGSLSFHTLGLFLYEA